MADLALTKALINSILTASENPLSLGQLEAEYKAMENEYIPFKEFGFKSLIEFLNNCTDSVKIVYAGGTAQLLPVVLDEARHIRELVENQKKDPHKKVAYKIDRKVEENILRLLANNPRHKIPVSQICSAYSRAYQVPLPGPRGKLVPYLSTSNKFAILTQDKNVKIIEALSHVDLSHYKRSSSLSEASMSALRASVNTALSSLDQPNQSRGYATNKFTGEEITQRASTPDAPSTFGSYGAPADYPPTATAYIPTFRGAYLSPTPAISSSTQSAITQSQQSYPRPSPAQSQPPASNLKQSQLPVPSSVSEALPKRVNGLSPEDRQLLIKLMMKHPESTSVNALHRAFVYHRGHVEPKKLLDWLISMEECLVVGTETGRVFLRPEFRSRATAEGGTATAADGEAADVPSTVGTGARSKESRTIQKTVGPAGDVPNGWHRGVETCGEAQCQIIGAPGQTDLGESSIHSFPLEPAKVDPIQYAERAVKYEVDGESDGRVLEGICGLTVTDIIDVMIMLWRRPKIPLDQLLDEFEQNFQRSIQPADGVEALVKQLSDLDLVRVALNSDVSLSSPVRLRMFEYESEEWSDVTECDAFWNKYMKDQTLTEGVCMKGKVECYKESGFNFVPNWSPPDHMYKRAEIVPQGTYVYMVDGQKFTAIAQSPLSAVGHWLVYLPDLQRFKPCRRTQLMSGPAPPTLDVIPIGRCPVPGEEVTLKIVQVAPTMTFACIHNEEVCSVVRSKVDPNFTFRVLRWDNQRFIPRGDLAKLHLDRGLTSMDSSAIGYGENFSSGTWMEGIEDQFFIPLMELVELLETMGFRIDAIHDLLLI